ncbi:P4 alpha zinc-binding domain protein [Agrobacterium tumefaciens]|uniref:DUF7146 domain-containing protein n=1 Tax=Agrobacterium tumefaciens TaxID=358 RepID=UPI001574AB7A|nr:toprim domain-containing protein [Agrobacterium tumefaciens]NSZ00519.1 P4 alpha zinc-binding domain protein [Agrobacterium tumefaciens]NSZ40194.1 P4 alpha zinc-binding domain protein [Agrobacterium tumefaciens]NTB22795.1 P4 alpha zinc-binding domain protein [Agrobacterium tumefaciens]NTB29305.1 P4 alpha zinc-binding domain protein [Agrobacterium tumefaciens]NTB33199.1 P4 alpha zinc-binding domain protein [Agrobacterium tumefaciens]
MKTAPLHERAKGQWFEILTGIGIASTYLTRRRRGPCPVCGGKDRFRYTDRCGTGSFFCNQCGGGFGANLVMNYLGCDFANAAHAIEQAMGLSPAPAPHIIAARIEEKPHRDPQEGWRKCAQLWRLASNIREGDPAWLYLRNRGLAYHDRFRNHLRFHPALNYVEDGHVRQMPALLAAVSSVAGEGVNIHRTYLTESGGKADVSTPKKMMVGEFPKGSAIRLGRAAETMGIAEGIETALSASQMQGMPVWSSVHANGLQNWQPPAIVKAVMIFGDNDENGVGQSAARQLAHRLNEQGIRVDVRIPRISGTDWNDVLRGAA